MAVGPRLALDDANCDQAARAAVDPGSVMEISYRRAARYAWARLLARIYEVFQLRCTHCGEMRILAFITDAPTVRAILAHLGEPTAPPRIPPARSPPLWEAADVAQDSPPDPALQPAPAYEFDQRLTW